jgi:hypothetical protein
MNEQLRFGELIMIDQETEYRKQMGEEAYQRQVLASKLQHGKCTCVTASVRRRWPDTGEVSSRTVHAEGCPKRQWWMARR